MLVLEGGPSGGDTEAMLLWDNPPEWIAVGDTPGEAVAALLGKMGGKNNADG
jgi:hypothetical protein